MNNNQIKYIELGFENIEALIIPIEDVNKLVLSPVIDDSHIISSGNNHRLYKTSHSEKVELLLYGKANKPYTNDMSSARTVFERIKLFSDIVDISYLDEDKNPIQSISVPWEDDPNDDSYNLLQKAYFYDDGLLVMIKKEEK